MDYLPNNYTFSLKPSFIKKDFFNFEEFSELKDLVYDIINGSCMAMVMNDEILWNEYEINPITFSEKILQKTIREYLCNNINTLFIEMFNKNQNTQLYFYLYRENPLLIVVFFDIIKETFTLKFFK